MSSVVVKTESFHEEDQLPILTRYDDQNADDDVVRACLADGGTQYFTLPPGESVSDDMIFVGPDGEVIDKNMILKDYLDAAMEEEDGSLQDENAEEAVRCGICGAVIDSDQVTEHFVTQHPDLLNGQSSVQIEHIPMDNWMHEEQMYAYNPNGVARAPQKNRSVRSTRKLRKVSQVRVNPQEMTMAQLEIALNRKMVEKIGRKVPVSLVDKKHARCDICNSIISLNKKFEVIHLVRHFQAWHPSGHRCAGTWCSKEDESGHVKYLSLLDFAVIDTNPLAEECLQCIYCGMLMDKNVLAMHFHEVHPEEVVIPHCHLCLSELVVNARVMMKFGEPFEITMPDEHHYAIGRFNSVAVFRSEERMDAAIEKFLQKIQKGEKVDSIEPDAADIIDEPQDYVLNSRVTFGRRNKPKRHFVMPKHRQAIPKNSGFVERVQDCHWLCRLCSASIIGAVTSAAAIRHYRLIHPEKLEKLQEELCKARLERVSDGCMEFLGAQLVYCNICDEHYNLHRPFNMCRAVRHLKCKHPERMPEFNPSASVDHENNEIVIANAADSPKAPEKEEPIQLKTEPEQEQDQPGIDDFAMRELLSGASQEITDEQTLAVLRDAYNLSFEKVHAVQGQDGETIYVLMDEDLGNDANQHSPVDLSFEI